MHYYQFNIADYQSHTRHLSPIEDICYRRMLDWVYLHEKPLPSAPKEVARILILNECLTDVERMLNEFFTHVEQGWINVRAQSEIEAFNEKLEKASKAGKASAEARKNKVKQSLKGNQQPFNERSTNVQPNKKQETRNIKQETSTSGKELAETSAPQKKDTELQKDCRETWKFYSDAYFNRYGTEPVRNAKVNTQVKSFVQRLGGKESRHVAAFYLQSLNGYYVNRGHSIDCLLADAEKIRTEWVTGRTMTQTRAKQIDKSGANASAVDEAMAILGENDA